MLHTLPSLNIDILLSRHEISYTDTTQIKNYFQVSTKDKLWAPLDDWDSLVVEIHYRTEQKLSLDNTLLDAITVREIQAVQPTIFDDR